MKSFNQHFLILSLLLVTLFIHGLAWAIPTASLTYIEKDLGGGNWQYNYTVTNTSDPVEDAGFDLFDIFISFNPDVTFTLVSLPYEWDAVDGLGFIEAFSLASGASPVGADIAPGVSLGGFVFQFDDQVGNLPFEVLFENPTDPGNPALYNGNSAPIPEPSTMLLLCIGLAGLVGFRRNRIKKL